MDQPGDVGMVRRLGNPRQQARQGSERRPLGLEDVGEVAPLDVLEDDEEPALAVMSDVIDPDDPRMGQAPGHASLGLEGGDLPRVAERARVEDLDRHRPVELVVARHVHPAEPAGVLQGDDRVSAEPLGQRSGRIRRRAGRAVVFLGVVQVAAGRAVAVGPVFGVAGRARGRLGWMLGALRFEGLSREDLGDRLGAFRPSLEVIAGCRRLAARCAQLDLDRQQLAEEPSAHRRGGALEELLDPGIAAVPPERLESLALRHEVREFLGLE